MERQATTNAGGVPISVAEIWADKVDLWLSCVRLCCLDSCHAKDSIQVAG